MIWDEIAPFLDKNLKLDSYLGSNRDIWLAMMAKIVIANGQVLDKLIYLHRLKRSWIVHITKVVSGINGVIIFFDERLDILTAKLPK